MYMPCREIRKYVKTVVNWLESKVNTDTVERSAIRGGRGRTNKSSLQPSL